MKNLRFFTLIIGIFLYSTASAINITTTQIITVTDSILTSRVGERLFPYFEVSNEGSHYNYLVSNKKMVSELFMNKKRIKKDVVEIWVLYIFNYTKIEGMKSGIWIKLDSNLELLEEPNLKAVPKFLIKDVPSNFITKEQAKQTAIRLFNKKNEDDISDPKLEYIKKNEKYIYSVANKNVTMDNNKKVVEMEIIELDAYTGKLLNRFISYNGLVEK